MPRGGLRRQTGVAPRHEAADDVACSCEAEIDEHGRGEDRGVALVAEKQDLLVDSLDVRVAQVAVGIDTPLEHGARDVQRARDDAVALPIGVGANVDQKRPSLDSGESVGGLDSLDPCVRIGNELFEGPPHQAHDGNHVPPTARCPAALYARRGLGSIVLLGTDLTLEEVVRVARGGEQVELAPAAVERMQATRAVVRDVLAGGQDVYGFTTGVGMRKRFSAPEEQARFNRALIKGHLVGQGAEAPTDVVRAHMVRMANGLALGAAGARPELAQLFVDALNSGVTPPVRVLGSVGQADLAANADLANGALGNFELAEGEALALVDNNAFSTAFAALSVVDCGVLLDSLDVAAALDLEAFAANTGMLDPAIGEARPYPGLQSTIARLRELLVGSYLWSQEPRSLQDPLTFRSLPQVHGAARDALSYVEGVLSIELNAHQGNPLVVVEDARIVSVGNFDVVPLAAALDFLRIALAPVLTSAAERALKLLQAPLTGLPEGLGARPGLAEPALSELGAAVQGLVAEARLLAQPVSFELASTSQHEGIEDRTTMAPLAARRLAEMVGLGARVVAVELTIAAQAVDLRGRPALGSGSGRAFALVRKRIPFTDAGEALPGDLEPLVELVRSGELFR